MQMLGGGMILCGCLGLGMWYRGQFLMRLHMTRELICLLDQWISEIRYNRSTLPEGCRQIGRQREDRLGEICNRVYREYAEAGGTGFLEIAGESFRRQLEALPLKKEEIDQFLILREKKGMRMRPCRFGRWNCPKRDWSGQPQHNSGKLRRNVGWR